MTLSVVDTNGVPGIRAPSVSRGRKDRIGWRLFVPDPRSRGINHIAIEPDDAPLGTAVPLASREGRPQDCSGRLLKFPP